MPRKVALRVKLYFSKKKKKKIGFIILVLFFCPFLKYRMSNPGKKTTSTTNPAADTYQGRLQALVENQLEGQRLLQELGGRFEVSPLTPQQIRAAPTSELQQHPALWEAFLRGWQACVANMPAPPASTTTVSPGQLSGKPKSRKLSVQGPGPSTRQPKSAPPANIGSPKPTQTTAVKTTAPHSSPSAKKKSAARLESYRKNKKNELRRRKEGTGVSQQFRLAKPGDAPASTPKTPEVAGEASTSAPPTNDSSQPSANEESAMEVDVEKPEAADEAKGPTKLKALEEEIEAFLERRASI